ncbi:MAG: hypothetical protein R2762_29605 [Bryobacteraceae bacterium]
MRPAFLLAGLGVMAALIGGFLWFTRGSHIQIKGEVLKVRTHAFSDGSSLAVVDFRFANPADFPFLVRSVDLILETADGKTLNGMMVAETDAKRMFEGMPELGQKYNETLKTRDKIPPHSQDDRMVAARFETSIDVLEQRKRLRIRAEEVDGAVSEVVENR